MSKLEYLEQKQHWFDKSHLDKLFQPSIGNIEMKQPKR